MTLRSLAGCLAFACMNFPVVAQQLNDTGLATCYNAVAATGTVSAATPDPETAGFNEQDCTRGAAAADAVGGMPKLGASTVKGRDYTKIANDGSELPASAPLGPNPGDWACTRDNVTGLVWEIKTGDIGLRGKDNRYTWYDADDSVNGGAAGADMPAANCDDGDIATHCDTADYAMAVNGLSLCGATNWRLPSKRELQSLVNYGSTASPRLDAAWFPNTVGTGYWAGTSFATGAPGAAWAVYFNSFQIVGYGKINTLPVRLVIPAPPAASHSGSTVEVTP